LKGLLTYGQSPWMDYIRRDLLTSGGLKKMIDQDGLRGMTSNPTIFEKAITGSKFYADILEAPDAKQLGASGVYEKIAIRDVQDATDIFKPVYVETKRRDGYVSLEVSPLLANDTTNPDQQYRLAAWWQDSSSSTGVNQALNDRLALITGQQGVDGRAQLGEVGPREGLVEAGRRRIRGVPRTGYIVFLDQVKIDFKHAHFAPRTVCTRASMFSSFALGGTPWPKLKIWPDFPAISRKIRLVSAATVAGVVVRRNGSRLP